MIWIPVASSNNDSEAETSADDMDVDSFIM